MITELNYKHTPYDNVDLFVPKVFSHCTLNNFDFHGQTCLTKIVRGFIEGDVKGIYFYGGFGVGKTHLLVSLYRVIISKFDDSSPFSICYITLEDILKQLNRNMDNKEPTEEYLDVFCSAEFLFLDDITAVNLQKDYPMEILRRIINERYERDLRTCFTSNADLDSLEEIGLHPHATSRIGGMCEIVEIVGKDRRRRKGQ
ncbi:hypothetical protein A2Z67_03750 [Candidatus Woesebacteria bacterium RBG_13_36_22]|uniref:Chromosomal replication initiator protein DnaA ATPAse domain-containing protein n=1 Tax=Candidatus Woesebacteria bacterium RBG_13_36_22 TaxID=1802478 RepID=A0A1F7X1D3_9BACT|nr:MAG: hypothetical protein A2Z67_03750 [Candidatus Woesebacteria bacterium RBG_13_36_22]